MEYFHKTFLKIRYSFQHIKNIEEFHLGKVHIINQVSVTFFVYRIKGGNMDYMAIITINTSQEQNMEGGMLTLLFTQGIFGIWFHF